MSGEISDAWKRLDWGIPTGPVPPIKEVDTVKDFAEFMKENGARIEEKVNILALYICVSEGFSGVFHSGPDGTSTIIYVQSIASINRNLTANTIFQK